MYYVHSPYPAGCVGYPGTELARFAEFHDSHERLMVPYGTYGRPFRSYDAAWNYNDLCSSALNEGAAWLWILNDDNVFAPDLLLKLLARNTDVIAPLCALKNPHFKPMAFVQTDKGVHLTNWCDVPASGIRTSVRMGCNGLLIQRHVLEKINPPWFEPGVEIPGKSGEDLNFTRKVVEAGFNILVDCDNRIGHMTVGCVWPHPPEGVEIEFGGENGLRQMILLGEDHENTKD